jgi:hypothetical protein
LISSITCTSATSVSLQNRNQTRQSIPEIEDRHSVST